MLGFDEATRSRRDWLAAGAGRRTLRPQLSPVIRRHFELGVRAVDGRRLRHKVETERRLDRYTFPVEATPAHVVIDLGAWMLFEAGPFGRG